MSKSKKVMYREVQRPRQSWFWIIIIILAGIAWYGFIQQIILGTPFGDKPAPDAVFIIFWLIFGVLFPVIAIWFYRLIIEVHDDGIFIRYIPFHLRGKKFLFEDLSNYEAITYHVLETGGWGIRFGMEGEFIYSMYGKEAIKLTLKHQTVIIGIQNPHEMLKVLDSIDKN